VLLVSSAEELHAAAELLVPADHKVPGDFLKSLGMRRVFGLDVEWRPHLEKKSGMKKHRRSAQTLEPCATLQISTDVAAVIFDLLALGPKDSVGSEEFSKLVASVFRDPTYLKLGFGLRHDLQRLAESYPHLGCFARIDQVLDVQDAWVQVADGAGACGLSMLCERHLGKPLSKRLQTSDWGARPLSREQVEYAALDAYCLIGLAEALPADARQLCGFECRRSSTGQVLVHVVASAADGQEVQGERLEIEEVDRLIAAKGAEIRTMKSSGAEKFQIKGEVEILLRLKARYKSLSGVDWAPASVP